MSNAGYANQNKNNCNIKQIHKLSISFFSSLASNEYRGKREAENRNS